MYVIGPLVVVSVVICQGVPGIAINTTGSYGDTSAFVDIDPSPLAKGLLIPRLTTAQRNSIANPGNSLLIFNTDVRCFQTYDAVSGTWLDVFCMSGCSSAPPPPTTNSAIIIPTLTGPIVQANWTLSPTATTYYIDVAFDNNFTNFVSGYNNLNVGNVTFYNIGGLNCHTTYYYRVRAGNACGISPHSNIQKFNCGIIYVIGGGNGSVSYLNVNEAYDPATNTWTSKTIMPTARNWCTSSAVNNVIYVIGGYNGSMLAINEAYDPVTDTWVAKTGMSTPRDHHTSSVVNNVIYVIGGHDLSGPFATNEAYDPATDTWTTKTSMPTARFGLTSSVVNNVIYVIGGHNGSVVVNINEAYDPATDTWTNKASMPTPRYYLTSSVVNNIIYVIGGSDGGPLSDNEAYDPATDTWTTKAPMPTPRDHPVSSVVNNVIYVIGGYNSGSYLTTNGAYDPATNTWTTKASMPTARRGHTSSVAP